MPEALAIAAGREGLVSLACPAVQPPVTCGEEKFVLVGGSAPRLAVAIDRNA